jgi:hypothetical protein
MRSEANIPEELKKSYDLLISPLNFTDVGCDCYEGGENPDGFMAVRKLYKAD